MFYKKPILLIVFLHILIIFSASCDKESPTETQKILLTKVSGDGQQGVYGDTLSQPLVVLVTDSEGKAVSNQRVDFSIKEGDGLLMVDSTTTDDNGQASTVLILGKQEGKITIEARVYGTNSTVTFTAIVGIRKPYSLAIVNGNNQQGIPGEELPTPLQVVVKDNRERLFEGAVINFSIGDGTGVLSAFYDTTNASGIAQTILTLGDSIGTTRITAAIQGLDSLNTVTFTALSKPPTIRIVNGNNQEGDLREELPQPLQVVVRNTRQEPIEGFAINFNIIEGNGTLSALCDTTDASGIAQTILTLGDSVGTIIVNSSIRGFESLATVIFTANALPPLIEIYTGNNQNGDLGEELLQPLQVLVKNNKDIPINGAVIIFYIIEGNGILSNSCDTTNVYGIAQTNIILSTNPGEVKITATVVVSGSLSIVTFTENALSPSIEIVGGNNQEGDLYEELPQLLQVQVKNIKGDPLTGITVNFNIIKGKGTLSSLYDVTDNYGIAKTALTLLDEPGTVSITASIEKLETYATVTFIAIAIPPTIEIVSGNYQMGFPGNELPKSLNVIVKNKDGIPVEGYIILFSIIEGTGFVSTSEDTTNTNGMAETLLFLGNIPGTVHVNAIISGLDIITTFTSFILTNSVIAFTSNRDDKYDIFIVNIDGSIQINLTNSPSIEENYTSWSPDGDKIVFVSDRNGNSEIYTMKIDGSNQINLTKHPEFDSHPVWSPDGSKIAFESSRGEDSEIFVMDADGTNQTNLTNNPATDEYPSWSPDGSKIIFVSNRDAIGRKWGIYIMNTDGSEQILLTSEGSGNVFPSWSPDGTKIVFRSSRDGNTEIYVMNSDGSNHVNLTNNPASDDYPSWSPDGSKIAFVTNRDGNCDVYVMNADGSDQINITNNPDLDHYPSWSPILSR